jgi:hypothetical protein
MTKTRKALLLDIVAESGDAILIWVFGVLMSLMLSAIIIEGLTGYRFFSGGGCQ